MLVQQFASFLGYNIEPVVLYQVQCKSNAQLTCCVTSIIVQLEINAFEEGTIFIAIAKLKSLIKFAVSCFVSCFSVA